jgi:hypothetical protein
MHWKMSIDLARPLVPSMGQYDPLDGFVTYNEIQLATEKFSKSNIPTLDKEISEMSDICRGINFLSNDPLGIGGLLFDGIRTAQLIIIGNLKYENLMKDIFNSALMGINSFLRGNPLGIPANYRLAFRELGLSIGLKSVGNLQTWLKRDNNHINDQVNEIIASIMSYSPIGDQIEDFWMQSKNWQFGSWAEHREINMVMLATSLAPNQFIKI